MNRHLEGGTRTNLGRAVNGMSWTGEWQRGGPRQTEGPIGGGKTEKGETPIDMCPREKKPELSRNYIVNKKNIIWETHLRTGLGL